VESRTGPFFGGHCAHVGNRSLVVETMTHHECLANKQSYVMYTCTDSVRVSSLCYLCDHQSDGPLCTACTVYTSLCTEFYGCAHAQRMLTSYALVLGSVRRMFTLSRSLLVLRCRDDLVVSSSYALRGTMFAVGTLINVDDIQRAHLATSRFTR
jgi:hypothetical protein